MERQQIQITKISVYSLRAVLQEICLGARIAGYTTGPFNGLFIYARPE